MNSPQPACAPAGPQRGSLYHRPQRRCKRVIRHGDEPFRVVRPSYELFTGSWQCIGVEPFDLGLHPMMPMRFRVLPAIRIRDARELNRYVAGTTALCVSGALAVDIVNQLVFFGGWPAALRSWCITVAVVMSIAVPVSRAIGKAHLALDRASRTDPLTGLLNRRALLEGVDDDARVLALIIADIDRFKQVNDTHGHLAGDDVLRSVSAMLSQGLRSFGHVGRLGGEEFALLVVEGTLESLTIALERVRDAIAATPVITGKTAVSVSISAGIARRQDGQSFNELYALADRALYVAKVSGRNRIVSADQLPPALGPDQAGFSEEAPKMGRSAA